MEVPAPSDLHPKHNQLTPRLTDVFVQMMPMCSNHQIALDAGTKPNLARLTIARRTAALVLSMWKHEEVYDPAKQRSHIIAQA